MSTDVAQPAVSSDDLSGRKRRARGEFLKLDLPIRVELNAAADVSDAVRDQIEIGEWFDLVRTLRQLHQESPEAGYKKLADHLDWLLRRS